MARAQLESSRVRLTGMRLFTIALVSSSGLLWAQAPAPDAARAAAQAVERLRVGQSSEAWTLLRATHDNTVRSFVIHDLARLGVDPDIVIGRLRVEADVSVRRALLLALGGYPPNRLSQSQRDSLTRLLRDWYDNDPDAGIHSAVRWLLGADAVGELTPASRVPFGAGWYVTAEGQTMATFRGALSVRMGSPADEPGRQPASDSPAEPVHAVAIPRAFALATTEVTVAEFRRFLDANPDVRRGYEYSSEVPQRMAEVLARFSPTDDSPAIAMTWYEAAMYCNWLSARDGLPPSEWVYPSGILAEGMTLPPDYLRRTGYRLPTEAEWELATRAGTTTSRFFGASTELLGEYAWFARNPPRKKGDPVDPDDPQHTSPVARLRPNDAGLFDVYGNVWEWTQDRVERHQTGQVSEDREDPVLQVWNRDARTRRGGAFPYPSAMARSALRGTVSSLPTTRRDNVGFRVARTLR
jgi:formylglycine-generating enzyme required for sulfatase activity